MMFGHYHISLEIPWLWLHNVEFRFELYTITFRSHYCLTHSHEAPVTVHRVTEEPPRHMYPQEEGIVEPQIQQQWPCRGIIAILHQHNVKWFGSHNQTTQQIWTATLILPDAPRCSQIGWMQRDVLSGAPRLLHRCSWVLQKLWNRIQEYPEECIVVFKMLPTQTIRMREFRSYWEYWPSLVLATGPGNPVAVRVWPAKTAWFGSGPIQNHNLASLGGPNLDPYPSTHGFCHV